MTKIRPSLVNFSKKKKKKNQTRVGQEVMKSN